MLYSEMQNIKRLKHDLVLKKLKHNPAVALLGPRQVGKTTLAKEVVRAHPKAIYLDLELDSDRNKVTLDPELFFQSHPNTLICLDEIQQAPKLFKTLRGVIDKSNNPGQFLILGSASRDLIKQSGETLAGRISYVELTPFSRKEVFDKSNSLFPHWSKGGYPKSFLQTESSVSFDWRQDYIRSFLERDLPSLGFRVPTPILKRFWVMLAHCQGQVMNFSKLANSLGVSGHTVKHYLHILEQTFLVRQLPPFQSNLKKRLIKSPKVYIRDTGLLHALLKIELFDELLGHPVIGSSFETFVIENILFAFPNHDAFFYRDASGNEVDLVLIKGQEKIAIEIKSSTAPKFKPGFWNACKFLQPTQTWLIGQVSEPYPGGNGSTVTSLDSFLNLTNTLDKP